MRNTLLFPILFCLILSGCTVQTADTCYQAVQETYTGAYSLRLSGEVTVKLQDTRFCYVLQYKETDGAGTLTVEEPESIAGLTASVSGEDGISLCYDGVSLYVGELGDYAVSPLSIMPLMLRSVKTRYPASMGYTCVEGTDCLETDFEPEPGLRLRCWFDRESLLPVLAELYEDDVLAVSCLFGNCTLENGG